MSAENLTSYIVLKENTNAYQHIYSSQKLKTFHSIYAKFIIKGNKLKQIDFYVKNYKGKARYGFLGTVVSFIKEPIGEKVLRIGIKLIPVIGEQKASLKKLDIFLDDIDNIFVASAHLKINNNDKLPVNEEDMYRQVFIDSIASDDSIYRDDNQKEFKKLKKFSKKELLEWAKEEDNPYRHKEVAVPEGIQAHGRNCRVSLMKTQK